MHVLLSRVKYLDDPSGDSNSVWTSLFISQNEYGCFEKFYFILDDLFCGGDVCINVYTIHRASETVYHFLGNIQPEKKSLENLNLISSDRCMECFCLFVLSFFRP